MTINLYILKLNTKALNSPIMHIKNLLVFCFLSGILFLTPDFSLAQTTDFEFWPSADLRYNISKKFRVSVEQQLRLDDGASQFKTTFTEAGLRYRISRYIRIRANYRFIIRPNDIRQRISGDLLLRYQKKKFPLRFNYRMRLQKLYRGEGRNPIKYFRNKLAVSYNLSKLVDPFVASELYYRLWNKTNELQKYRLDFGMDWRLNKKSSLSTFYRFQKEINVNNPALDHVIGIGYSYTLR